MNMNQPLLVSKSMMVGDPEFVNLDPKYTCVRCQTWLESPHQALCGHRICLSCLGEMFQHEGPGTKGVPCPARDEDCPIVIREQVFPDFSATREIKQQLVFCTFKKFGCRETISFAKLKAHSDTCEFRSRHCPHCSQTLPSFDVDMHIENLCQNVPVPCPYRCGISDMPRCQLKEHCEECPSRPRRCCFSSAGCTFQGSYSELEVHEHDTKRHLEIVLERAALIELENVKLRGLHETMAGEMRMLTQKVSSFCRENEMLRQRTSELSLQLQQFQDRQLHISTNQSEKISKLELQSTSFEKQNQELERLKAVQNQHDAKMKELEKQGKLGSPALPDDVQQRLQSFDQSIALHDVRLADVDMRSKCLETANYDGVLIWKISDYRGFKRQAVESRVLSIYSQPFYTSRYGYKMCARVYPNGDGIGKGTHLSLFFVIMRGDYDDILAWPFRQKVTLTLVDQKSNRRHLSDKFQPDALSNSFQKPVSEMNIASGCPLFIAHSVLDSDEEIYLRNNTIYIKVVVDTSDLLNP